MRICALDNNFLKCKRSMRRKANIGNPLKKEAQQCFLLGLSKKRLRGEPASRLVNMSRLTLFYFETTDKSFLSRSLNFPAESVTTIPLSVTVIGVPDFTSISDFNLSARSPPNFPR